ncbi:MAG TPA: hypothetical protein VJN69_00805 [Candidatus Acidoferrales bacterium]|nr:hypothetical protein [Candidatus Acidoferrales bacterium]
MAIDCAQFEEIVHELERAGTPGFDFREDAFAHAESCRRCACLLEKVMALEFALDSLAVQDRSDRAPARVEAALLAEFRRQHAEAAHSPRTFRLSTAVAMAAALLLAIGIMVPFWMSHRSPATGRPVAIVAPNASIPANANEAVGDNSMSSDSEYTTDFVSLPYADDPGTLEGGTVVRVTLSRSALASFGLPVTGLGYSDRIPADIALSEDGVPQAIRLVADANLDQTN